MNRLKDATYQKSNSVSHNYDENLTYDKNGNIVTLLRYTHNSDGQIGAMKMDELTYDYKSPTSNQLMKVTESLSGNVSQGFIDGNTTGDDYAYDANGNMTVDKNKNITSIVYNHLNLPTQITFGTTGNIVYIYTASGQKVKKVVTSTTPASVVTTDYLGGYQYSNSSLQFFPTAEGYVKNTPVSANNIYSYVFNYTDHLGNVRLSYTKNPSTNALTILEESNYYPFGLKHNGYNIDNFQPEYKYRFGGKELQDELSLNMYDYGARGYDPAIGRFSSIDPLAELSRRWTPYNYAYNNPMYFVDPDGMLSKSFMDDLIKKSDDNKETKWTFNDDGSASGSNGASVNAEESEQQASSDSSGDQDKDKDKNKGKKTPRPSYTPAPKSLPGFPDAEKVKPKGGRPRWRLPDGDIIEWDGQHGELERYNPRGKHKGVWSPDGEEIKDPVPGRKIDPVLTPPSPTNNSPFMDHMAKATGLSGTALIIYIILSEGSRAFPPRNLVPIP
jgi:RHS repeat-associated protein